MNINVDFLFFLSGVNCETWNSCYAVLFRSRARRRIEIRNFLREEPDDGDQVRGLRKLQRSFHMNFERDRMLERPVDHFPPHLHLLKSKQPPPSLGLHLRASLLLSSTTVMVTGKPRQFFCASDLRLCFQNRTEYPLDRIQGSGINGFNRVRSELNRIMSWIKII